MAEQQDVSKEQSEECNNTTKNNTPVCQSPDKQVESSYTQEDPERDLHGNSQVNFPSEKEEREEGLTVTAEMLEETEEDEGIEEDEEDDDDDDDDNDGWITPGNIRSLKQKMANVDQEKKAVEVGCVTTDFAMQVCQ